MHLVDSSSIIAILTAEDSGPWLRDKLDELRPLGGVFINQIVFAETCAMARSQQEASEWLEGLVERVSLNWECSFPAGSAYRLYKERGGKKPRMLPDFLIAAHAASLGWSLVTNNPADVRSYFPTLKIISPD
jgi:predicted nucleic acid-binding protein